MSDKGENMSSIRQASELTALLENLCKKLPSAGTCYEQLCLCVALGEYLRGKIFDFDVVRQHMVSLLHFFGSRFTVLEIKFLTEREDLNYKLIA